jgi:hypothetical protein
METQNREEQIAAQKILVDELVTEQKKTPTEERKLRLNRETDYLRHLINSSSGSAKSRSKETAEVARLVALNRAIAQAA